MPVTSCDCAPSRSISASPDDNPLAQDDWRAAALFQQLVLDR
jgi:hypothetical protein